MTARPWMKWYPADWRSDSKLRACAPLSRYVWLEMLGLMHEAEPYGHLVLAGRAMDYQTLSRLVGVTAGEVKRAVKELEDRGVFSRNAAGVIYSRRMVRDENRREKAANDGRLGGNPILTKQQDSIQGVNHLVNGEDKAQKPEARNQKEEARERAPPDLWFDGQALRLNRRDFEAWQHRFAEAYPDFWGELSRIDGKLAVEGMRPGSKAYLKAEGWLNAGLKRWQEQRALKAIA